MHLKQYILTSPFITNLATKCYVLNPPRIPDHKAIVLKLRSNIDIGKGYWKLNTNYLKDEAYIEKITQVITEVKTQYDSLLDRRQLWGYCKLRIKEESIRWGIHQNYKQNKNVSDIETQINQIDCQINTTKCTSTLQSLNKERQNLVSEQNRYYTQKAQGAQIRSRAKWVEEGEKNTSFFLKLERKHQTNNIINSIQTQNGNVVYNSDDILKESVDFYQTLYSKQSIDRDLFGSFFDNIHSNNILNDSDANVCEGIVTPDECFKALESMARNKSPGYDGIPTEFYVTFWNEVKDFLVNSYNEAFVKGELSNTQKQIIISLLFKKHDRRFF